MRFKRSIKGYAHYIAFEILFVFRAFFDSGTSTFSQVVLSIASVIVILLLMRFIFYPYIKIDEGYLIKYSDFYYREKVNLQSIMNIKEKHSFFSDTIFLTLNNGKEMKLNESYLSKKDKNRIVRLIKNGASLN